MRFTSASSKPFVLLPYPICQDSIEVDHYFPELSFTKLRVVINPTSDHRVDLAGNVLQPVMIVLQDSPTADFFPYFLARFLADGWLEGRKDLVCLLV